VSRFLKIFLLLIIALCGTIQINAQAKRPITFEDMMKLKRVSDPVVSPDGKWVMYSAMDVDLAANTKRNHLWLVPVAGGEAKQITNSAPGESRGRFSPDGKRILFISARDGSSQIWLQDFDSGNGALSGNAIRLTNISSEADGASWSPDGKNIVFISEVYPECGQNPADADKCNAEHDAAVAAT
jgi:Tol biopolymer transport system component